MLQYFGTAEGSLWNVGLFGLFTIAAVYPCFVIISCFAYVAIYIEFSCYSRSFESDAPMYPSYLIARTFQLL
jgi:hypothetical protein